MSKGMCLSSKLNQLLRKKLAYLTHIYFKLQLHIYVYIYMYMYTCVCVNLGIICYCESWRLRDFSSCRKVGRREQIPTKWEKQSLFLRACYSKSPLLSWAVCYRSYCWASWIVTRDTHRLSWKPDLQKAHFLGCLLCKGLVSWADCYKPWGRVLFLCISGHCLFV